MDKFLGYLDAINDWCGRVFGWVIVLICGLVVIEVILRRFFNAPTIWNFEVVKQLYSFHFMILMGYTLLYRGHVAIDLIYEKFSRRTRAIVNVISYVLFFFPFVGVMIWQGTVFAQTSWAMKETSWSVFAPPLYPVKTVIPVAFALLLIQGISVFISQILVLVRGK